MTDVLFTHPAASYSHWLCPTCGTTTTTVGGATRLNAFCRGCGRVKEHEPDDVRIVSPAVQR